MRKSHLFAKIVRRFTRLGRRLGLLPVPAPQAQVTTFTALTQLRHLFDEQPVFPRVLYFGDSVVERVSRDDSDIQTLGEMVVARLGGATNCACISHSAYHPSIYYALLQALARMKHRPELLILPINMRCFSPQWDLRPAYQFEQELAIIEGYLQNPESAPPIFEPRLESVGDLAAYDAMPVDYPSSSIRQLGEFRRVVETKAVTPAEREYRLGQIFKFHYTHRLVASHRKLLALRAICELLPTMQMASLFYFTPINHQAGERYAGSTFDAECQANIDVLRQVLRPYERSGGIAVVDLSRRLDSAHFVHADIANEHLNESGRALLAREIVERVSTRLTL